MSVRESDCPGNVCKAVRRVRLRKSNYLKIIPMHMMIREIGRQQRVRWCPV